MQMRMMVTSIRSVPSFNDVTKNMIMVDVLMIKITVMTLIVAGRMVLVMIIRITVKIQSLTNQAKNKTMITF